MCKLELLCVSPFLFLGGSGALALGTAHLGGPEQLRLELCLENLKYNNSEGKQHMSSQLQLLPHVNLISTSRIM